MNGKESNYEDGLDPTEEILERKKYIDDTYFPSEESETPHY